MEINFSKHQEDFLQRLVDEGFFPTIDEAVISAVYDQEQQMGMGTYSIEEIREMVAVGLEASQRGEVVTIKEGDIRREGLKILEQRRAKREG